MKALTDLYPYLIAWGLAITRLSTCWAIVPLFSKNFISGILRSTILAALAIFFIPSVEIYVRHATTLELVMLTLSEVIIGVYLGFCIALFFWIIESAATIIDAQSGALAASMLNPMTGNEEGVFAGFFYWAFVAFFVTAGGILWIFSVIAESYRLFPPGQLLPHITDTFHFKDAQWWFENLDYFMYTAFQIAAPVVVAMLIVELSLGIIGRFAPQLQVFFIAMPLKILVALGVLSLQALFMFERLANSISEPISFVERIKEGLGG